MYGQLGNKVGAYGLPSSDEMCAAIEILRHVVEPKRKFPWGKAAKVVAIAAGTVAAVYLASCLAEKISKAAQNLGQNAARELHAAAEHVGAKVVGELNGKPIVFEHEMAGWEDGAVVRGSIAIAFGVSAAALTALGFCGIAPLWSGPLVLGLTALGFKAKDLFGGAWTTPYAYDSDSDADDD